MVKLVALFTERVVVTSNVLSHDDLFLPEPEPREVRYTVISVDDHLVEPPDMFEGRLPAKLQALAPRVVTTDEGAQEWEFDGQRFSQIGMAAIAGRKPMEEDMEPARFDHMRPACYDVNARVHDMDINGVWASLNFPSQITGFCGRVFSRASDPELGLAVTQAWNDWVHDEWWQPHPDRIIPLGLTYLSDPEIGAAEIRRNAERGFRSVTLPERPHHIGFPSLFSGYWDPIIEACVETDTVISLHVGSSGGYEGPADAPNLQLGSTLFGQLSLSACAEWLWSGYPLRYPTLKVAMSEGGIGWVAMLLDRLDNLVDRSGYGRGWDERPADVLRRNFWFCTLDDPSTINTRHAIGVENIMLETDYPHGDGTWPDTQDLIGQVWGDIPAAELRAMCCENAARLYRHPLPPTVLPADK
ncbi:amidohydrolase family protein [Nocardia sp. CA-135953]|uniref:amidohydrolase family protein n=1 Tax=Nocardia sp. CA-135953 TaxID=3239978 RepID=UPI003D9588A7